MSEPAGKAKSKDGETQTQAVQIIASSQAQAVRHIHPVILFSVFLIRFKALVANPVSAMSNTMPVLIIIQVVYATVCLPAAGSQVVKPAKKLRPGEKKKPGAETTGPNIAVVSLRYV